MLKISLQGTNLELTEALKQYVDDKIGHLDQFLDEIMEARVELEKSTHHNKGEIYRCEVNLDVPQVHILRADSTEEDLYAAIDTVVPKLKSQIDTYKAKHRGRNQKARRVLKSIFPRFE